MPKWQISAYVSGNFSNWCHFIQIFAPPRTTNRIAGIPHAEAVFAVSRPASWNGHFCSAACCCSHERGMAAWLQTHQARWPGLHNSNQREKRAWDINVMFCFRVEVLISKGKKMVRPAPVRAYSHDGFLLLCSVWLCMPVWGSETKLAFPPGPRGLYRQANRWEKQEQPHKRTA